MMGIVRQEQIEEALLKLYRVSSDLGHLWARLEWEEVREVIKGISDPQQAAERIREAATALSPEWGGVSPEAEDDGFTIPVGQGGKAKAHFDGSLTVSYEKEGDVEGLGSVLERALVAKFSPSAEVTAVHARYPAERDFARVEAVANTAFDSAVLGIEEAMERIGKATPGGISMDIPNEYEEYRALYFREGLSSMFASPQRVKEELEM